MSELNPNNLRTAADESAPDKRALTVEEFMAAYGFGRTTTYELLNAGKIEAKKHGRKTLVLRDSADAFLNSLPSYSDARAA